MVGKVTKSGVMNKTVTVSVDRMVRHDRTHKMIRRTTKFLTHDPRNVLRTEDVIRIKSCPRKSHKKYFELDVILKRGWDGLEFDRLHPNKNVPLLERVKEQQKQQKQAEKAAVVAAAAVEIAKKKGKEEQVKKEEVPLTIETPSTSSAVSS
ncbi:hypothetical protein FRC17_005316 [Serendipita sp. 399]|nr:hypothetical protein FRC17_005316 [Serendipita sp. 399]